MRFTCFFLIAVYCLSSGLLSPASAAAADDSTPSSALVNAAAWTAQLSVLSVAPSGTINRSETPQPKNLHGWDYLAALFVKNGVDENTVNAIFSDSRMPQRESLVFSLDPKESGYNYTRLNTASNRAHALSFYAANRGYFQRARTDYQVPEGVVLAILQVETACGANTGNSRILPGLARLATAAAPDNLAQNMRQHGAARSQRITNLVLERALDLETTFLPHALAVIEVARYHGTDPLELRGSPSGALGFPQFLPGNYFQYGVDADANGKIDLFTAADAVVSIANYLRAYGWDSLTPTVKQQRKVIWQYNRSDPYISTVLNMASLLQPAIDKIERPAPKTQSSALPSRGNKQHPAAVNGRTQQKQIRR